MGAGVALALGGAAALWMPVADAVIPEVGEVGAKPQRGGDLVSRLSDPETSADALESVLRSPRALRDLSEVAVADVDASARGWAIVGLTGIEASGAGETLTQVMKDGSNSMLVRTWAAAALVNRADSMDDLRQYAQLQYSYPGLDRPLRLKVEGMLGDASLEELLALSTDGSLAQIVSPAIISMADAGELAELVYTHPDDPVRRQATAFLGAKHQQGTDVSGLVIDQLRFDKRLDAVPWEGGALYVPGIQWGKDDGQVLITELMAWWLYLEAQGKRSGELNQVWNNLYSYSLLTTCGYDMSLRADAPDLVSRYAKVQGNGAAKELLRRVGLSDDKRFRGLL
jgi:hypothetical protein